MAHSMLDYRQTNMKSIFFKNEKKNTASHALIHTEEERAREYSERKECRVNNEPLQNKPAYAETESRLTETRLDGLTAHQIKKETQMCICKRKDFIRKSNFCGEFDRGKKKNTKKTRVSGPAGSERLRVCVCV